MDWDILDYIAAVVILGSTVLGLWLVTRVRTHLLIRLALVAAILILAVLIWAELAVGILD